MDPRILNQQFSSLLDQPGGQEKIAQAGRILIQDRIYEASYARKLLTPQPAPEPLQVSVSGHDDVHVVVDLPPEAAAMSITFRGDTRARVIRAPRVPVGFWSIQTEKFNKTEQELRAYSRPITTMIEERIPKIIQEIEDRTITVFAEAAIQAVQLEANANVATTLNAATIAAGTVVEDSAVKGELSRVAPATGSAVPLPLQRSDIVRLKKTMVANKMLRGAKTLITEFDFADVCAWTIDDLGSQLAGETLQEGYKATVFFQSEVIQTLKTRVLRPGNVYSFAPEEAVGVFFTLADTKFFVDKRGKDIEFWAWEDIGMAIVNIRGVAKLELYPCDANPGTDADGLLANVTAAAEANIGVVNNRADTGVWVPPIGQF